MPWVNFSKTTKLDKPIGQVQIAVFGKCTGALLTPNSKRNHVVT